VHGFAEHAARYDRVVGVFREYGLTVARFDLRGHGRSGGPRGHITSFDDYTHDLGAMFDALEKNPAWKGGAAPVLFGHSLGGLISTHYALTSGTKLLGLSLTSPFYGLAVRVPAIQLKLGKLVNRVLPTLRQSSKLKGDELTHDAALAAAYDKDPYHFDHVTVGWFEEVRKAQERLADLAPRLALPVFCIAAGDDRVVSVPTIRRVFDSFRSTDKELDVRSGLFHEVLNELDWRDHAVRLAERMVRWSSG
jgi:alpha-beta hydrolase superfamily lysophospholipase